MNCFWLIALGQDSVKGTHMIDFVCWKLSYHIFSFHIWTLGISFTGGFTYSPCLVSWTRWPRTDIVFHSSHSDASAVRTVGGKQPKAIFPCCQVKRTRMQHMQCRQGGRKGETCYRHFSPRNRWLWPRIQGWRSSMNRLFNPIYPNPTRAKHRSEIVWSESSFIDSGVQL